MILCTPVISHKKKCLLMFLVFSAFIGETELFAQNNEQISFSIYYENDKYLVKEKQRLMIDSVLTEIDLRKISSILVKSHTDEIGTLQYNKKLAERRLNSIRQFLPKVDNETYVAVGESFDRDRSNRRTDVKVTFQKKGKLDLLGLKKGDSLVLDGIYFEGGTDKILTESTDSLTELSSYLKENEDISIELVGHICCSDRLSPNFDGINIRTGKRNLSEARARAVAKYLFSNGISEKRVKIVGAAYNNPLGKGDSFDRRVELKILSIKS